jgi:acyl carrier protein
MNRRSIDEGVLEAVAGLRRTGRGEVRADSRLAADLLFTSLDFVRLAAGLQRRFGNAGPLPFQRLFVAPDGSMLVDVTVSALQDFVSRHCLTQ